jgi:hypothetical protein
LYMNFPKQRVTTHICQFLSLFTNINMYLNCYKIVGFLF